MGGQSHGRPTRAAIGGSEVVYARYGATGRAGGEGGWRSGTAGEHEAGADDSGAREGATDDERGPHGEEWAADADALAVEREGRGDVLPGVAAVVAGVDHGGRLAVALGDAEDERDDALAADGEPGDERGEAGNWRDGGFLPGVAAVGGVPECGGGAAGLRAGRGVHDDVEAARVVGVQREAAVGGLAEGDAGQGRPGKAAMGGDEESGQAGGGMARRGVWRGRLGKRAACRRSADHAEIANLGRGRREDDAGDIAGRGGVGLPLRREGEGRWGRRGWRGLSERHLCA